MRFVADASAATARESPLAKHGRGIAISAGVGVGGVLLVTLEQAERFGARAAAYGALMGALGYVFCAGAAWSLRDWLRRTRAPHLARSAVYFVAGMASWILASWIADAIGLVHLRFTLANIAPYLPI